MGINWSIWEIDLPNNYTIFDIKDIILEDIRIPISAQTTIYSGKCLQDNTTSKDIAKGAVSYAILGGNSDDDQTSEDLTLKVKMAKATEKLETKVKPWYTISDVKVVRL